ncbi:hypothetical protein B7P43_G09126 [Cryptotermes secundus]|uniref:C2H2-type domain-containing protein n=1 Tax=Cryptotermes secundus TaxID=105785 RepID=A0A2J7Q3H0_9NEOP|nr:uncharacterized protein LOC111870102 isoform X3 [Cryptotermes secundus]PNF23109.1 hypothetical protein B7P43_G09126 [Cryptotermes secundus]
MDKNGALLQDIQNFTNCSKFNFVSIKEEPPEDICSESDLTHFENSEIKFQVHSEDGQQICSMRPLDILKEESEEDLSDKVKNEVDETFEIQGDVPIKSEPPEELTVELNPDQVQDSVKSVSPKHETSDQQHGEFFCQLCNKKFSRKCGLVSHMLIHEGVKPFKCENGGDASDSQLEVAASMCSDEGDLVSNQETDHAQTQVNKAPPRRNENKVFVSPRKIPRKSANTEDPRIGEAYTALQATIAKKRDEFNNYGEYIANVLRSMDKRTRAFVKKEFSDIIFKAESGIYTSPSAITQSSGTSCDYSRSSSSNNNYSYSSSMPSP